MTAEAASADVSPAGELRLLTVCKHGAGRSQIAAAYISRALAVSPPPAPVLLRVAGTAADPWSKPLPRNVLSLLDEVGLSSAVGDCNRLTAEHLDWADLVLCFAEPGTWPEGLADHPGFAYYEVKDIRHYGKTEQRRMRANVIAATKDFLTRQGIVADPPELPLREV